MNSSTSNSRRFILALLTIYGLGLIGFVAGSEWIVRTVVAPSDGFEAYKASFQNAKAPTAVFGDSRAANGIENSEAVVNLGYAGETLSLMIRKAEAIAEAGHAKRIVIQVAPQQFAIYRVERSEDALADELFSRGGSILTFMKPQFRRYLLGYWGAALADPGRVLGSAAEKPPVEEHAPRFLEFEEGERSKKTDLRLQLHAPLPKSKLRDEMLKTLETGLERLKRRGMATCLVEFPVTSYYRNGMAKIDTFATLRTEIAALAEALGVRFLDLTETMPDDMFSDPDHLGPWARKTMTDLLVERCYEEGKAASR